MENNITPEFWQVTLMVLGPIGALLGAYTFRLKNRATAELERVRTQLRQKNAEIEKSETENKIRLLEAESRARQEADQSNMLKQLQTERMDWLKQLEKKEEADERNYKVLKGLQDSNTHMLMTEIQNQNTKLTTLFTEYNLSAVEQRGYVKTEINALNEQFRTMMLTGLQEAAQMLGSEIGMTLARQMAIQNLDRELIPFPSDEDPRWRRVFLTPNKPDVWLFKQPYLTDNVRLQKPCAQIKAEGHWVRVISEQLTDWLIVMKENGETCYGYLPVYAVKLHEQEPAPA